MHHSHRGLAKIKQVRRLLSIRRGLSKNNLSPAQITVLTQEWKSCLKCTAFEGSFIRWCMTIPEIGPPPISLPSQGMIQTMYQFAKHDTDACLYQDRQTWLKKTQYLRHQDAAQLGHKHAFANLKNKNYVPVQSLHFQCQKQAIIIPADSDALVYTEDALSFQKTQPVKINGFPYQIIHQDNHSIQVKPIGTPPSCEEEVHLAQEQVVTAPSDMVERLNQFWQPYWNIPDSTLVDEEQLRALLQLVPENVLNITGLTDLDAWKEGIRRLKPHSARGIDTISAAELKTLPSEAIADIRDILLSYRQGFPAWFMTARTFAIPKTDTPLDPSMVRPITVLSQLYRLWSQIITRKVLDQLSQKLPYDITGFLPQRGCVDASYMFQYQLEQAIRDHRPTSGCSLDLRKCFNTIKRKIPIKILGKMGMEITLLTQWSQSQDKLQRVWAIGHHTSMPVPTNNGCPEGDPMSVVCMLAVAYGWTLSVRAQTQDVSIGAYADNWGWSTEQSNNHIPIADATVQYVHLYGMSIDWGKTWVWATHRNHLPPLQRSIQRHAGLEVVKQLTHEMDHPDWANSKRDCTMLSREF